MTVPLLGLAGIDDAAAHLEGVGPIDPATARQLFADAPSFLRLATDPISGAPLKLGRERYRPSKAQRTWLALRYGRCTRPGCDRLAVSADLDHLLDWHLNGETNDDNLAPACRSDHRLKHETAFTVARSRDGTVTWRSPTGFAGRSPPLGRAAHGSSARSADASELPGPALSPLRASPPAVYPEDPGF